jgi:hypothetical protein
MTRDPSAVVGTLFGVVVLWYLLQHAINWAIERWTQWWIGWWERKP